MAVMINFHGNAAERANAVAFPRISSSVLSRPNTRQTKSEGLLKRVSSDGCKDVMSLTMSLFFVYELTAFSLPDPYSYIPLLLFIYLNGTAGHPNCPSSRPPRLLRMLPVLSSTPILDRSSPAWHPPKLWHWIPTLRVVPGRPPCSERSPYLSVLYVIRVF